jgi:hypothetical protein
MTIFLNGKALPRVQIYVSMTIKRSYKFNKDLNPSLIIYNYKIDYKGVFPNVLSYNNKISPRQIRYY